MNAVAFAYRTNFKHEGKTCSDDLDESSANAPPAKETPGPADESCKQFEDHNDDHREEESIPREGSGNQTFTINANEIAQS